MIFARAGPRIRLTLDAVTPELRRAVVQRSVQILVLDAIWLVLFLVAAGTVRVWAAWAYLGLGVALAVVNFLVVAPRNPEVIVARSRGAQKGTKGFETWFGLVFGIAFLALPVVAGLDAVRFGWSHLPEWLVWVGLGVVVSRPGAGYAQLLAIVSRLDAGSKTDLAAGSAGGAAAVQSDAIGSWTTRLELWRAAGQMLADYPALGAGLYTFYPVTKANYVFQVVGFDSDLRHAHNLWLQAGASFG